MNWHYFKTGIEDKRLIHSYLHICHMKVTGFFSSSSFLHLLLFNFRYCSQGSEAGEYPLCLPR
jgi:hypothetical protein